MGDSIKECKFGRPGFVGDIWMGEEGEGRREEGKGGRGGEEEDGQEQERSDERDRTDRGEGMGEEWMEAGEIKLERELNEI